MSSIICFSPTIRMEWIVTWAFKFQIRHLEIWQFSINLVAHSSNMPPHNCCLHNCAKYHLLPPPRVTEFSIPEIHLSFPLLLLSLSLLLQFCCKLSLMALMRMEYEGGGERESLLDWWNKMNGSKDSNRNLFYVLCALHATVAFVALVSI